MWGTFPCSSVNVAVYICHRLILVVSIATTLGCDRPTNRLPPGTQPAQPTPTTPAPPTEREHPLLRVLTIRDAELTPSTTRSLERLVSELQLIEHLEVNSQPPTEQERSLFSRWELGDGDAWTLDADIVLAFRVVAPRVNSRGRVARGVSSLCVLGRAGSQLVPTTELRSAGRQDILLDELFSPLLVRLVRVAMEGRT